MKFTIVAVATVTALMLAGTFLTSIQPYASGVSQNPTVRDRSLKKYVQI